MELTKEQKQEWQNWLAERPENVRKVTEKIVPCKKYRKLNRSRLIALHITATAMRSF